MKQGSSETSGKKNLNVTRMTWKNIFPNVVIRILARTVAINKVKGTPSGQVRKKLEMKKIFTSGRTQMFPVVFLRQVLLQIGWGLFPFELSSGPFCGLPWRFLGFPFFGVPPQNFQLEANRRFFLNPEYTSVERKTDNKQNLFFYLFLLRFFYKGTDNFSKR